MREIKGVLLSLSLFVFIAPACAEVNDFDRVCRFFTELSKQKNIAAMSHIQRNDFIVDRINKQLPASSDARVAWQAVAAAESAQRYEIYRSGAEAVLNKTWQCPAMEKLAAKTGLFE